ncbi:MAG TPA: hypothetical protein PKK00_12960 [Bacteroidales bacterium]|nr:hypothetical protein [Bacteroidales bacterium]HPS18145.1 hypothetical protein [Bacteroidales bacterium]
MCSLFKKYFFLKKISLYIFIVIIFFSCSQERKLAHSFIKSADSTNILFLKPDNIVIILQNQKVANDSLGISGTEEKSISESSFLNKIKSKSIVDLLQTNMMDAMKNKPFKVFSDDNMNAFINLGKNSYIVKIVQIEMDEFYIPYSVSETIDTTVYSEDFNLNAVSLNLWIEVTEVNGDQDTAQVLFCKDQISEMVNGYFHSDIFGEVKYIYKKNYIIVNEVYDMASEMGALSAAYLYDYFLNKYIHINYSGEKVLKYFHYDVKSRTVYPAGYNRFIFL